MKQAYLVIRSVLVWAVSLIHFSIFALIMLLARIFLNDHRIDWLIRFYFRNIQIFARARVKYVYAPGFDRQKTSIFISNHVNMFDPFVLYVGIPQIIRGVELESHFKIPFYGWLMLHFGNVPVPEERSASGLKKMFRLTKQRLEEGVSLVVFPEGSRTLDGRVHEFEEGGFVLAQKFGVPVVPVSIVGSFEFKRKGDWMLRPNRITVYIHDSIETTDLKRKDLPALSEKVYKIVSDPVHAHLEGRNPSPSHPPEHAAT